MQFKAAKNVCNTQYGISYHLKVEAVYGKTGICIYAINAAYVIPKRKARRELSGGLCRLMNCGEMA